MRAKTVSLPEAGTFFVYWLPKKRKEGEPLRVLVSLHGTNGNAYRHLANFTDTARTFGVGVASIQCGWQRKRAEGHGGFHHNKAYREEDFALWMKRAEAQPSAGTEARDIEKAE